MTVVKRKLDQYPLSYTQLVAKVRAEVRGAKPLQINAVIKGHNIKRNPAFADYSFRTKSQEEEYSRTGKLPAGATSIYNEDAVRFVVQQLQGAAGA